MADRQELYGEALREYNGLRDAALAWKAEAHRLEAERDALVAAWFWTQVAHAASIQTLLVGIEEGGTATDIAWFWAMVCQVALAASEGGKGE